ncbi:MAG: hypothetical protein JWN48_2076 [Myxococcaceae bacterium]|nr:hypothetical protein [Myxococcaceae bacterium]
MKDQPGLAKYINPDVPFVGLVECQGKQDFLGAAERMLSLSTGLEIRAVVGDQERAMVAYDLIFSEAGSAATAALLGIEGGLIKSIELFFDKSPFKR